MTRLLPLALLFACTGEENGPGPNPLTPETPDSYVFESRFDGADNVSYSGQIARHLLIADMKTYLGDVTGRINDFDYVPEPGDVEEDLLFFFDFDSTGFGELEHSYVTAPPAAQQTYNDVSSGKDLRKKLAGNDPVGQHADWTTAFVGWPGAASPEGLVLDWFAEIDAQAADWVRGDYPTTAGGHVVPAVYVTPAGQDLQQLLQKFLLGAIAFSQGADDYLDDDTEGKGLLSAHEIAEVGTNYTALEHAWDEGFGYFGASRTYIQWSDAEIAAGTRDIDGSGGIDLLQEACWGHSVNAAKRDVGARSPTDFTADAWERAIAATIVHYINDVLRDMGTMDTADYDFASHAKHWSELKGFALSLQFNPRSPVDDASFALLHDYIGVAPILDDADASTRSAYADDLIAARALLGTAYGFDVANLGDAAGENGW